MKKTSKRLLSILFFMIVLGLTLYSVFKDQSIPVMIEAIKRVNPMYFGLGFLMMIIFIWCDAVKLRIGLSNLKEHVSVMRAVGYALIGFFFNSITPSASGGQIAQVYYMSKDKIKFSHSTLTLLIITSVYQFSIVFYAVMMYFLNRSFVVRHFYDIRFILFLSLFINLVIVAVLFFAMFSKKFIVNIAIVTINSLARIHLIKDKKKVKKRVIRILREYRKGASYIKKQPQVLIKLFLVTLLQLTALFSIPYLVYLSFSLNSYTVLETMSVQSLLTLGVSVLPLPGGMGASESAFVYMYKLFYTSTLIVPAMIVSRFISFYGVFLISGLITLIVHFNSKRKKQQK